MAEVNVNIRGRDEGLGRELDSLRQKAQDLGREVENLNNIQGQTPTQQRISIDRAGSAVSQSQIERVRSEHASLRQSNIKEYIEAEKQYKRGEMSKDDFDKQTQYFNQAQEESIQTEDQEIKQIQKEMAVQLRSIHKEMTDARKIERETAQRDRKEFDQDGILGKLQQENEQLKRDKMGASSAEEIADLEDRIQANKQRMKELNSGGRVSEDSDSSDGRRGDGFGSMALANSAANANLLGTATQLAQQGGSAMGSTKGGLLAAGIIGGTWGLLSQGGQAREASGRLGSLRGDGVTGTESMANILDKSMVGIGGLGYDYGMTPVDFLQRAESKARMTGNSGGDILGRTERDLQLEKGMGVDVSGFNQFERFNVGQKEASEISLDILNVLNAIERSSLKEGDLATFTEKIGTMQTLMSIQRTKRDLVDTDSSLRMLAAFESIGLSQKGERAGDFLQNTIGGLGEGGSDNAMLLKYEAAKRAHPELANDPAALRRFVRFRSDDPTYMNEWMKMSGRITEGNDMAADDLLFGTFNPQSEEDINLYKRAMKSGDFSALMTGQKPIDKGRSGTMTQEFAGAEAMNMAPQLEKWAAGFKSFIGDVGSSLEGFLRDNTLNVNVTNPGRMQTNPNIGKSTQPKSGN